MVPTEKWGTGSAGMPPQGTAAQVVQQGWNRDLGLVFSFFSKSANTKEEGRGGGSSKHG